MKIYFIFGLLTVITQFGVGLTALRYGRYKEALIGIMLGIVNSLIYLCPNKGN